MPLRQGWSKARAELRFARERASAGARAFGRWLAAAPWRRIGIGVGGVFAGIVAAILLFLAFADWNALRGPIGRMASSATGREIVIAGDLDVDPWSWTPELHAKDLRIGNASPFRARGAFAAIDDAHLAVRLWPLLFGRIELVKLDLDGADLWLYRNAEGVSNWAPRARQEDQLKLPAIRRFVLRNGHVVLRDEKRKLTLDADFTTEESADPANPGRFELSGRGRINRQLFTIELTGAPLLNVRRSRPYRFAADVRAGATRIAANGAIRRPFDFSVWSANVRASGPDLADLYHLIGLALPNTPPYRLRGRVERAGQRYGMPDLSGRVGDSDLRGRFTATRRGDGRLFLDGDFRSSDLDFDDAMAVFGGPPATGGGETASAEQRAMAANLAAQGRLLPDAQLDIGRVRNMDARVSYRATRVRSARFPLRGLTLDISLERGLLRVDPVTLELRQGRLSGAVALNARGETPRVDLDLRLTGARLESAFGFAGSPPLTGALTGRARLSGSGGSLRDAAANADGEIVLATPRGEVREAFAELTGINVARGLGLLLSGDRSTIGIRCGVAAFRVRNGVAHVRSMVIDTETMLIRGGGSVSLRDETMDLELEGEPKEPRLIRFAAPITLEGRLRDPELGVDAEEAAGQTGFAAALGSLVAPLAAILPFVDFGLAEDANCAALLAGRERQTSEG